jgi:phosphoribosylpyrophosphate synthetase
MVLSSVPMLVVPSGKNVCSGQFLHGIDGTSLRFNRATALADRLNLDFALINRKRKRSYKSHTSGSLSSQFNMSSANTPVPGTPLVEGDLGRNLFSGGGGMSNSFHMSMTNSSVSVADSLAGIPDADVDEDKPDKMELLVGDVKGKVSSGRLGSRNVPLMTGAI